MLKRTFSFLLVMTMLATCLIGVPVFADTAAVLTNLTPDSGQWAEKTVMTGDTLLAGLPTDASQYATTYNAETQTITETGYTSATLTKDLADLSMNSEADGVLEVAMTVAPTGDLATLFPDDLTYQGPTEDTNGDGRVNFRDTPEEQVYSPDGRGWTMRFFPFVDNKTAGTTDTSNALNVKYDRENQTATYSFPWDGTKYDYTSGVEIPVKYVVEKSGNTLTATNWAQINGEWIEGTGVTVYTTEVTETTGKLTGLGIMFSVNNDRDDAGKIDWKVSNVTITEAPLDGRISDLSGSVYTSAAQVPLEFAMPKGYTSATLTVDGAVAATFDGTSRAYSATLDLSVIAREGSIPVVLSGLGADGTPFSVDTTVNKASLSAIVPGGQWAEKTVADDSNILDKELTHTNSSSSKYDAATHTATIKRAWEYYKLTDFDSLRLNEEEDGIVEIYMTAETDPTYLSGTTFANLATLASGAGQIVRLVPCVDNVELDKGNSNKHIGYYVVADGSGNLVHGNDWVNSTNHAQMLPYTAGTKTPLKLVIEKTGDKLTTAHYVNIGGEWRIGNTSSVTISEYSVTDTTGKLTGFGMNFGCNGAIGSDTAPMKWIFSNASVVEKTPETARLTDFNGASYPADKVVPVDFVLPVGYTSASITVGGSVLATMTPDAYPAGAYTTAVDLSKISATGEVTIELSGTDAEGTFAKFTSLTKTAISGIRQGGQWAEKTVADDSDILDKTWQYGNSSANKYDPATHTSTTVRYWEFYNLNTFDSLRLNEEEDGTVEIYMTAETDPTHLLNTTFKDLALPMPLGAGKIVRLVPYVDDEAVSSGSGSRHLGYYIVADGAGNLVHGNDWTNSSNHTQKLPYTPGTKTPLKLVIEKKDGKLTTAHYVKIGDDWRIGMNSGDTISETNVTDTTGKLTGFGLQLGGNNSTYQSNEMKWIFSNASVVEKTPETIRLSDLSSNMYASDDTIPVDFVLPADYTSAVLTVNGEKYMDFAPDAYPAGAYTSSINLSELNGTNVPVVLEATVAGATVQKTTTIAISDMITAVAHGGQWQEKEIMNNAEFLGGFSGTEYTYDGTAGTATFKGEYSAKQATMNLPELMLNSEKDGSVEITMNVNVKPDGDTTAYPTKDNFWGMQFNPVVDGTADWATRYHGLIFENAAYSQSQGEDRLVFPRWDTSTYLSNYVKATPETTVPYKVLITKTEDGTTTLSNHAFFNGNWQASSEEITKSFTTGNLTGIGLQSGGNNNNGDIINWVISNASVVQKTPETVRLTDLSACTYVQNVKVPVDFVLPVGYTSASLKFDGNAVASFGANSYEAGAYTTELLLEKLNATVGDHTVVLEYTDATGTYTVEETLTVVETGEIEVTSLTAKKTADGAVAEIGIKAPMTGTAGKLMIAAYSGEDGVDAQLAKVQLYTVTVDRCGLSTQAIPAAFTEEYDYIKVFIWNGSFMESLADAVILQ